MKYFILFSLLCLLILLIKTRIKPSLLFFSFLSLYYVLDLIKTQELLINFVNTSIMTLMILLVVASILEKTVIIDYLSKLFFKEKSFKKNCIQDVSYRISFFWFFEQYSYCRFIYWTYKKKQNLSSFKTFNTIVFCCNNGRWNDINWDCH